MTRKLAISAHQVAAICKGAAKAGFVAEIEINGVVIRLVPEEWAQGQRGIEEDEVIEL